MEKLIVVKIGGSTFDSRDTTIEDIVALQQKGWSLVVVHGGANVVSTWLKRQNVPTRFVNGERVTDLPALEMVIAVLGGLVNKEIVAAINCKGGRAAGISGVDGALIQGKLREKEMGYVGTVAGVDPAVLQALLGAGFIPVVSSISLHAVDRPDGAPQILNINGDPIAGEIAAAIRAEKLVFLTDVEGIRDQSGKLIPRLSAAEAEMLIGSGVASGGMIPKIRACQRALTGGAVTIIIDGRKPHALLAEAEGRSTGTTICEG